MPGSQNGRSGSSKDETIHGCALSGDLFGLQKRLQDNPSLVNERNSILSQTPLHVAAGNNNVDIVKFLLLEWKGAEKVELEAKNMYGETPLHMAAKNGCSESAQVLIVHGASLEAKTVNGMTPLHLAVWHALIADDCVTVGTLLEFSADCGVKDDEGKTPLDHVSQHGGCSEMLRELLTRYSQEQRKRKAIELFGEAKERMEEFEAAMSKIVGLQDLKSQLYKWAKGMLFDEKRRALGLNIADRKPPHMAFLGNPGTGNITM